MRRTTHVHDQAVGPSLYPSLSPPSSSTSIPIEENNHNNNNNNNNNNYNIENEEDNKYDRKDGLPSLTSNLSPSQANIFSLFLFLVCITGSAVCYYSTLEGGDTEQWLHAKLYGMALWMVVSTILFTASIMIALTLTRQTPRRGALVYACASMACMFALDQGNTVQHHGAYNSLAFIVFMSPMMILAMLWRTCYFRLSFRYLMCLNFGVVASIVLLFVARAAYVKNDWNKGLLGQHLNNGDQFYCQIDPPTVNAMAILPYRAWNFWAGSHKCTPMIIKGKLDGEGLLTIDNCKHHPQYAVLPNVVDWTIKDKLYSNFQTKILQSIQTFNYTEPVHVDAEAILIECGEYRNVLVRSIEREDTKKRVNEFNNKNNDKKEKKYDILFLNFDAVARSHFHRRFPKSKDFITKLHKSGKAEFFEFFRYHVLEAYTFPNLIAMYSGVHFQNVNQPNISTIWDQFYNNGYVSASVDNSCLDWSAKYQKERVSKVDHQLVAPFCLPEVHPLSNPYGNFAGPFSILRRCLAGDYVHKYSFEYMRQFIGQYVGLPKFMVGAFNEGHEGTGEVIGLVDDDFVDFLGEIDYDNTIVFIVSDHGLHMNIMFAFKEESTLKENALGLLTAIFPKRFLESHPDIHSNLQHNRQSLVTPYDIFETLHHLSVFPEKPTIRDPHSLSLFDEISYHRTCDSAHIPDKFCICNKDQI